jgi:hypothetical protein
MKILGNARTRSTAAVAEKEIVFTRMAPVAEQQVIHADREGHIVSIKIHYSDRMLTEKFTLR